MLLGAFTARFNFGLLVIAAPESRDPHIEWDPARTSVHAGKDSIYLGVRQTASGLVSVTCVEDHDEETSLQELFSGTLTLPSGRLTLYDPDESVRMTVPVSSEDVAVTIYGNHQDESSELQISLRKAVAETDSAM
jgi:hypothetical protein